MVDEQSIVKAGYLTKSPPQSNSSISFKNWRRRWFVLLDSWRTYPLAPRSARLEYYTDEKISDRKGMIDLSDVHRVHKLDRDIRGHRHLFNVVTGRRCYHLSADTEEERNQWIRALLALLSDAKACQPSYSGHGGDDVLTTPKLISSGSDDDFGTRHRGQAAASQGSDVYSVIEKAPNGTKKKKASLTYDEDWADSEDEPTSGPSSVRPLHRTVGDEHLMLSDNQRDPHMAAQRFSGSPRSFDMRPVHFGEGSACKTSQTNELNNNEQASV